MFTIAVIGAGQLGSRHLQGLAGVSFPCNLHIVDPSEKSINAAKERLCEVDGRNILSVFSHQSPETLPAIVDLAVVATTSDVRMKAIEALCRSRVVRNIVLEKVLFQQFSEYSKAAKLIQKNSVKCWVNCPRRIYPIYLMVQKYFKDDPITYMEVQGGDWGLGCNGVHFLDLLAFMVPSGNFSFNCDGLDNEHRRSKRSGFVEFSGMLRGTYGLSQFNLISAYSSTAKHLITMRSETKSVVISEVDGCLWKLHGDISEVVEFSLPYQSQLTGRVAESILLEGTCGLTPYEESAQIHLPFLKSLGNHGGADKSATKCALT